MRIGLIADTHDNMPNIRRAVEALQEARIEALVHVGDFIAPFALDPLGALDVPIHAVFGNNDGERAGLQSKARELGFEIQNDFYEFELGGKTFLAHHFPINESTAVSQYSDRDYIITGHTHHQRVEQIETSGTWLINPGEACGYLTGVAECGVLDTSTDEFETITIPA